MPAATARHRHRRPARRDRAPGRRRAQRAHAARRSRAAHRPARHGQGDRSDARRGDRGHAYGRACRSSTRGYAARPLRGRGAALRRWPGPCANARARFCDLYADRRAGVAILSAAALRYPATAARKNSPRCWLSRGAHRRQRSSLAPAAPQELSNGTRDFGIEHWRRQPPKRLMPITCAMKLLQLPELLALIHRRQASRRPPCKMFLS